MRYLSRQELAQSTRDRYRQIAESYWRWLGGRAPTVDTALDFIAGLRVQGYRQNSRNVYIHVVRSFHGLLGQKVPLKAKKERLLPDHHEMSDIERLLVQAQKGLRGQTWKVRCRNYALIATMAFTGLRRGEAMGLRVRDLDFGQRFVRVRVGKGNKGRVVPMIDRLVVPLREQVSDKPSSASVFELSPRRVGVHW